MLERSIVTLNAFLTSPLPHIASIIIATIPETSDVSLACTRTRGSQAHERRGEGEAKEKKGGRGRGMWNVNRQVRGSIDRVYHTNLLSKRPEGAVDENLPMKG